MRGLILFLLLLGGCPHHMVAVTTKIDATGASSRRIVFQEKENNRVWGLFAQPAAPYQVAGKPEDGVVATAPFKAGVNNGGIRFWMLDEKQKNRGTTRGSRVVVEVEDLLVARVCRYRERIDLGLDPGLFRKELPGWIDHGIAIFHEALKVRFPGTDFAPLKKHVDENLKPRLVQTLSRLQLVAAGLMRDYQSSRIRGDERDWSRSVFVRSALAEAVEWGLLTEKEATPEFVESQIRAFDEETRDRVAAEWSVRMQAWLARQLAPGLKHLDAETLGQVRKMFVKPDDQFEKALETAAGGRFPDEDAASAALQRFGVSVLGIGIFAMFENVELDFETTLPGKILFSNGEVEGSTVRWAVREEDLFFADPQLHATSVEMRPWAAKRRLRIGDIPRIRALIAEADPEKLAVVRRVAAIEDDAERARAVAGLSKHARMLWDAVVR